VCYHVNGFDLVRDGVELGWKTGGVYGGTTGHFGICDAALLFGRFIGFRDTLDKAFSLSLTSLAARRFAGVVLMYHIVFIVSVLRRMSYSFQSGEDR